MVFTQNLSNNTVSMLKVTVYKVLKKLLCTKVLTYGLLHRARSYPVKIFTWNKGINLRAFTPRQRLPR